MRADYHIHTWHSDDCECPMSDMVDQALRLGLDEIVFTEHADYGVPGVEVCDFPKYFEELKRMREIYGDRITIRAGAEFGVQTHTLPIYHQVFAEYDFDFVILSTHERDNQQYHLHEYQKGKTPDEYHRGYYEHIYDCICGFDHYSVLGHLDVIKRYEQPFEYPDDKILDIVEKILRKVIADGKGIEVNTSSFKYKMKDLTPSRRILQLYHDLGGKIITIGSDSHVPQYLESHFDEVKEELKKIGFTHYCTFEKMKPIFWEL